jgi:hypothetical protein
MTKRNPPVRWSLVVPFVLVFSASANGNDDDAETRHLAAGLYINCLGRQGERIQSVSPNAKPSGFERIAAARCKEAEDRLRQLLQLDILLPQVQQKRFLNKEAQAVLLETIEQTISRLRRSAVIVYAEEFDKRHPGLRSCSLALEQATDEKLRYFCAVRD